MTDAYLQDCKNKSMNMIDDTTLFVVLPLLHLSRTFFYTNWREQNFAILLKD